MEELYYTDIEGKQHFVHEHIPDEVRSIPFIFINPLFDEKKRSQKFYANTARKFSKHGVPVIRFDYYGTGDSDGQLHEMNFRRSLNAIKVLIDQTLKKYQTNSVNLLGIRFGADLALKFAAEHQEYIHKLVLIEPIVIGTRYIKEQRLRRKIFQKLHKMVLNLDDTMIDGVAFEDHQGYPISRDNLSFFEDLNSLNLKLSGITALLFKLDTMSSRKTIPKLAQVLEQKNDVHLVHLKCNDFWSILEPVDTKELSNDVVTKTMEIE